MKKSLLGILALPMMLTACDRPEVVMNVLPCCSLGEKIGMIKFAVYSDGRAVATVKGEKVPMTIKEEEERSAYDGKTWLNWVGTLSDGGEIDIYGNYDFKKHLLSIDSVSEGNGGYSADVFQTAHIKRFDNIADEVCISNIRNTVYVNDDGALTVRRGVRIHFGDADTKGTWALSFREIIPADDIKLINEKWDYSTKDWWKVEEDKYKKITEFGDEPCAVLERLDKYIADKGLKEAREEVICQNPKNVYMECENCIKFGFQYLTLATCDDGHGVLNVWHNGWDGDNVFMTRDTGGNTWTGMMYDDGLSVSYHSGTNTYMISRSGGRPVHVANPVDMLYDHQKCARQIDFVTRVNTDGVIELDIEQGLKVENGEEQLERKFVPLTQAQALTVTRNWGYPNPKMYKTGDLPHEVDACNVLEQLQRLQFDIQKELKAKK